MIWIVGAAGMLGRELTGLLKVMGRDSIGTDAEVSILDPAALGALTSQHAPSAIVNCAAYTAVDAAEDDADRAHQINAGGVENLARLAADCHTPLVHLPTDYVFDGTSSVPLREDAATGPLGVYGASKLAGERAVRTACPDHYIVRTAWVYGRYGKNFVTTMLRLMGERDRLTVVDDQTGSPTWTRDLSRAIVRMLDLDSPAWGTYHFSGEGQTTWYGFARRIYDRGRELGLITSDCQIDPVSSGDYPTRARRPRYSLLDKTRIRETFGVSVPHWEESLDPYMYEILHET